MSNCVTWLVGGVRHTTMIAVVVVGELRGCLGEEIELKWKMQLSVAASQRIDG